MSFKRRLLPSTFLAAMALSASLSFAADPNVWPLPPEKTSGALSYTSGGVPHEQLPAVRAARGDYPLVLELYERVGNKNGYTAYVEVRITDSKGNVVLEDKSEGPFFLVKAPPGNYTVEASLGGRTLPKQRVSVPARGSKRVVFIFPQASKG